MKKNIFIVITCVLMFLVGGGYLWMKMYDLGEIESAKRRVALCQVFRLSNIIADYYVANGRYPSLKTNEIIISKAENALSECRLVGHDKPQGLIDPWGHKIIVEESEGGKISIYSIGYKKSQVDIHNGEIIRSK